ncbi:MAG: efflux RND transporter periplasmic adaptor subunit, partial [Oscillospiraceae bacterium]
SDVLKDLNEKLAQCIIKSDANGVITNINGVVGSSISTGILAVIQDTDNLVVSTSFKEYDVSNVKIGQKVIITSDATGEKEIIGTVSQLSMTSASSTDTSFPAEITINDRDTGLLIGMTAKIKVVLKEKNNIFVVPFDAVGLDANGDSVVYSQGADGKFSPIKVTTGESNDYEIEIISPDIKEGMIIRASADENAAGMMPGGAGAGGDMGGNMATMVG